MLPTLRTHTQVCRQKKLMGGVGKNDRACIPSLDNNPLGRCQVALPLNQSATHIRILRQIRCRLGNLLCPNHPRHILTVEE